MTRRFASHYVYSPALGYLRQYAVEIGAEGYVTRIFPLEEETASVSWLPGVIVCEGVYPQQKAVRLYPFDFTKMQPAGETRRIPLP